MMRCRRFSRHGQSLVEFALIAPLLFALMFVLVELGIVFSIYIGLTNTPVAPRARRLRPPSMLRAAR